VNPSPLDPASPIPHRFPILCVDSILVADQNRAVAEYLVREGPHVDDEMMWEVGMIEGLAQTAAVLENSDEVGLSFERDSGMLVGVRNFTIHRRPRIGERLEWHVEIIRRLGPFLLVTGEACCGEELLAEGELRFYREGTA
jgi:predicted hotdog family 3-hydroxylacyl-ACP dehydratase